MDGLESFCGLLWCFYQLFGLSFWRHPFTAEDVLMNMRCNATFLQISSDKESNSSSSWMAWGWVYFQQIFISGWTIPLSPLFSSIYYPDSIFILLKIIYYFAYQSQWGNQWSITPLLWSLHLCCRGSWFSVLFNIITLSLTPVTMYAAFFLSSPPYCLQCLVF